MCKTVQFVISNAKNIVFLVCALGTVIAFCITLYGIPPRIDKAENDILAIKQKQEMFELRFGTLEESFKDLKDDMKEIKADIKLLLRTK